MEITTTHILIIAVAACAVLAAALLVSALAHARQARRIAELGETRVHDETALRRLTAEINCLMQAQKALAGKIDEIAAREPEASPQQVPTRGYEHAIRMARTGAPAGQIVASCGMTRSEADLLVALHGPQAAA